MPTQEQWLEAEKRGLLPPDKQAILDEARKRGLIQPKAAAEAPAQGEQQFTKVPQTVMLEGQEVDLANPRPEHKALIARTEAQDAIRRGQEAAEKRRLEKRGIGERALDTAAFATSIVPRVLSGGDLGLGDYLRPISKSAAESAVKSERDFALANQGWLGKVADFGEASLGIPSANAMGMPLRVVGAAGKAAAEVRPILDTAKAVLASPRGTLASAVRGTGEALQEARIATPAGDITARLPAPVSTVGRGLEAAADYIPAPSAPPPPPPSQAGLPPNMHSIPERLADIQAFNELGIQPFAPATGSRGTARAIKTIEDIPIIGGTVTGPKTEVELGAREAQRGIARELGAQGSEEQTGQTLQRGLERFQGAGMEDLDPNALRGQPVGPNGPQRALGIEPYQPVKPAEVLSGPAQKRLNDPAIAAAREAAGGGTAANSRGATVPNARPLNQISPRRTNVGDLSDTELARFIRAPSRDTSLASRAEALYESAERKIPGLSRKDGSANSNQIPTKNLGNALQQTVGEVGSQIAGQNTIRGELAESLMNPQANFTYGKLRNIRTEIGRALGNFGMRDVGLDRSQLKRLYGAATQDMENGLRDIANRAWRDHIDKPTATSLQQARNADAALYEFRRADRYFRQGMERIDRVAKVLDASNPNEAVRRLVQGLREKTANPQMLREVTGMLRPNELNELRGHIIEQLGSKRAGAQMSENVFNFNHFGTDFHAIMDAPGGREFMTKGMAPEVLRRLENLARISDRMKFYESTKNFSGSGLTALVGLGAYSAFTPMGLAHVVAGLAGAGLAGKLLTSAKYLKFQESLMRAQLATGNTLKTNSKVVAAHIKQIPGMIRSEKDPDLIRGFQALSLAMNQELDKAKALPAPQANQ